MTAMADNGMATLTTMVPMMAAMMLPSAVPAIAGRVRRHDGVLAASGFAASYVGIWTLLAAVASLVYRAPSAATAAALLVAGFYELTPIKRECRRRCREYVRSGLRFGILCARSSLGLMLVLVGEGFMNLPLMLAIAVLVLAQKLFPPHPAVDVPLALLIVAVGVLTATI